MRKVYSLLVVIMLICLGCEWHLKSNDQTLDSQQMTIKRFDRLESLYLTTGDYSALLQMNRSYPMQTRMLIEDVLRLGEVDEPDINQKFLSFFNDSTLQQMISDVQKQYANMDDLDKELAKAFSRLKKVIPSVEIPQIYAQIGSFNESVIVDNNTLGISLDKYLGADYPFYKAHYAERQRQIMTRSMITPDCLSFYLLSLFPMPSEDLTSEERGMHMGKIQWVVNQIMERRVFTNNRVTMVDSFMKRNRKMSVEQLLREVNYSSLR